MHVPDELNASPPRDPSTGRDLYSHHTAGLIGAAIATVTILPAIFYQSLKSGDGLEFGPAEMAGAGATVIAAIVMLVLFVRRMRARAIYIHGVRTQGVVDAVQVGSGSPSAKVRVRVLYQDATGKEHRGEIRQSMHPAHVDVHVGTEVPVLVEPSDPRHFAVYSLGLGLVRGRSKT